MLDAGGVSVPLGSSHLPSFFFLSLSFNDPLTAGIDFSNKKEMAREDSFSFRGEVVLMS